MGTTVGIVGTGVMGAALVRGWLRSPDPARELLVCGFADGRAQHLADIDRGTVVASIGEVARRAEVIMVVVKPEDSLAALDSLRPAVGQGATIISSAAGISLERMRLTVGPGPALLRIVPNLGVELGEGVVVLSPEPGTDADLVRRTAELFACLGVVEVLAEDALDAVAAVAGSSIGFLALALEGVEEGAVSLGLPRATAQVFVRQMALAAALLLRSHTGSPADLKDQVASPGGSTIAGLAVLEDAGVRGAFIRAIEEAAERSRRLRDLDCSPVIE
jgi:pyrroline-5-carboxylate reductase